MARPAASRRGRRPAGRGPAPMLFTRRNYVLLLIGVLAVVAGYVMMRVDNQVEGFVSLYLAPLVLLFGYLEIIFAILWRPGRGKAAEA